MNLFTNIDNEWMIPTKEIWSRL